MREERSDSEVDEAGDERRGSDSTGTAAEQAKEREREMEESGEENAA